MHVGVELLIANLGFDAVLFAIPAVLGLLLALTFNIGSRPIQGMFVLGTPCVLGFVTGSFYLWSPEIGKLANYVTYGLCVIGSAVLARQMKRADLRRAMPWLGLFAMTYAAAAFYLALGFLHGGHSLGHRPYGIATANTRYMKMLPIDNNLPYQFAAALLREHRPISLPSLHQNWSFSDRPPLETALYLVIRAFGAGGDRYELRYQVLGTWLQALWLPALWCFLCAARMAKACVSLTITAVLFSGFVIVNSFFVWPKLFSAAFLVLLGGIALTDQWQQARKSALAGGICGAAGALAMLAHQGAFLAIIPLALVAFLRRNSHVALRFFVPAALVFVILQVPWALFQTLYNPPGTKLAIEQLTNRAPKTNVGVLPAVERAYDTTPLTRILRDKVSNLETPFLNENNEARALYELASSSFNASPRADATRASATKRLRTYSFYYLLPSTGFLIFGLPVLAWSLLRRRKSPSDVVKVSGRILWYLVISIVMWALILFGPAQTVMHQGAYSTELLLDVALVAGLWELSPVLAGVAIGLQVAIGVVVYGLVQPNWHIVRMQPAATSEALLAAGAALVVVVISLLLPQDRVKHDVEATSHRSPSALPAGVQAG